VHYQSLNKLSNAFRASLGEDALPVEVCFSTRTLMEKDGHSLRASFFATRSCTGCMHSNLRDGSK
jgi:hypothetical protein